MSELKLNLVFDDYQIKRAKPARGSSVIHVNKRWIGKEVSIIPLPFDVDEKVVDKSIGEDGLHHLELSVKEVFSKTVSDRKDVGFFYLKESLLGLFFLIVEAPEIVYWNFFSWLFP